MIFHDVQQNTDAWFELRKGLATSSNFGKIMANENGAFGNPAVNYAVRIAYEQKNNVLAPKEQFTNQYMEDGHIYEPVAIDEYERETFNTVSNGGFYQHETMLIGGSPDGIIKFDKGGVEVKSVKYNTQRDTIKRDELDPKYKWQVQGNIWLGDMEYMDYISYCHYLSEENKLFIKRVYRDEDMIKRLEIRLTKFQDRIQQEKKYV